MDRFEIGDHQYPGIIQPSFLCFFFFTISISGENNFMRFRMEKSNACPNFANLIPFLKLLVYPLQLVSG